MSDGESCLLQHFAKDTLFACLVHVDKTTRKIQCAFRRFFGASAHKKFVATVYYYSNCRRTRIEIVGKAALCTMFRFLIVFLEMDRAAHGAEVELV